jgi:ABC-type sugar transport system ATPase subunit
MAEALLALRDIAVVHGPRTVLEISRLDVAAGETLAIVGANGAGKSTLLRLCGLLQRASRGEIFLRGEPANAENSARLRRSIASVFQEPLLLNGSIFDNAALGLKLRGLRGGEIHRRVSPWLEKLGIARLAEHRIDTLSGGEAQRTSLARALVLEPELLLLDEPFSALDSPSRAAMIFELKEILRSSAMTAIFVTHDLHEAEILGRRLGVMCDGRLRQIAPAADIFRRPADEDVAAIVGMSNRFSVKVVKQCRDYSEVSFGSHLLPIPGSFAPGRELRIGIRPEHISVNRIEAGAPLKPSQAAIPAIVAAVSPWMGQQRITLNAGEITLTALQPNSVSEALKPREHDTACALIDTANVHIF